MIKNWDDLAFWGSNQWRDLQIFLEMKDGDYYPSAERVFQALALTHPSRVRAVILGQDPYHDGSATGLAFSANISSKDAPPSLQNIFTEYSSDLGFPYPDMGDLSPWATQGVLLLNSILTVAKGEALSHAKLGWQELTSEILREVVEVNPNAVFILWGKEALNTASGVIRGGHRVTSNHPSPLSADRPPKPFFGSRPFTKTNALLINSKQKPIDWRLPS